MSAGLMALLGAPLAYYSFVLDGPPPADADLRLVRAEVPREMNGFHLLGLKEGDVYWPEDAKMAWDGRPGSIAFDLAREIVDQVASGKEDLEVLFDYPSMPWLGYCKFLFQPNKTMRLWADGARVVLEEISKPGPERRTLDSWNSDDDGILLGWLDENAAGRLSYERRMPVLAASLLSLERLDLDLVFTQVLLALKCHRLRHGTLPGSLDELVPEFLHEIPMDPGNGKPLHYCREKGIVYSIGNDPAPLDGIFLGDRFPASEEWYAFPADITLAPGEHLVVFCDGNSW